MPVSPEHLEKMRLGRERAAARKAEATDVFLPLVEQAFKTLGLDPARPVMALVAKQAADAFTPDEDGVQTDVARLLALQTAAVYKTLGMAAPASVGRMETELNATGEPVVRPGPGGEGQVVMTPDEERRREERAAQWAKEIWSAPSTKAAHYLTHLRNSPPMDVYNPENRMVIVNGIRMPLPEGLLRAKMPGRLPGRQSAGPDGRPRWGCVAIAEIINDWSGARQHEKVYQRYAHSIVIHGERDDMAQRAEAQYEYGDLEVVGR